MKNRILLATVFLLSINAYFPIVEAKNSEKPTLGSGGGILFTDHFPKPPEQQFNASAGQIEQMQPLLAPLADTFLLHSYPSSNQKLFLDFDGFDGVFGDYTAWSMDGDDTTFSDTERTRIQQVWQSVSEDFLPFAVDVTTEDPGGSWLGQRAVIDGSLAYTYSWGYGGDWASTADREAYVYPYDHSWVWIADSVSHEIGHTLNLSHDGNPSDGAYYYGHGSGNTYWTPIMGWTKMSVPYGLSQWDDGEYVNTTNPNQDDLATIDAVTGVNFRPDDHGSTTGTATPISFGNVSLEFVEEGIIEKRTDLDYFSFTTYSSGNVQFVINSDVHPSNASHPSSNLDVLAKIHDSGGAVLYTSNPVDEIYASFNVTLPVGNYYISIDGTGLNDPSGPPADGYSDYASLGYYSIQAKGNADGTPVSCAYTCGDLDGAGINVDMVDFGLFTSCWDENPLTNPSCICANMVELGGNIIDLLDLSVFAELFLSNSSNYPPNDCSILGK